MVVTIPPYPLADCMIPLLNIVSLPPFHNSSLETIKKWSKRKILVASRLLKVEKL
jgi:hypothetical protein